MKTTDKTVQVHYECICGHNEVYSEEYTIKWKDLSKYGIKRRISKKNGEPFLFRYIKSDVCSGDHWD